MPIAVRITSTNMRRDEYEKLITELEQSGLGEPEGRLFHAGYGDDQVHVFEVWDSRESFQPYHDDLMARLPGAGIDGGIVHVEPIHTTIRG